MREFTGNDVVSNSPDDESTDVSAGGQLEEVKVGNVDGVNARDVTEGAGEALQIKRKKHF